MTAKLQRNSQLKCFYCPYILTSPQGRAAHIRLAHKGLPYQPSAEQIAKYSKSAVPHLPPIITPAVPARTAPLTPREHLERGIADLQSELENILKHIPELETRLHQLRRNEAAIRFDLQVLENAQSTIEENANAEQQEEQAAVARS